MKFYTVKQLAEILNVKHRTIYKWIHAKRIGTTRFGRREIRFSEEQIHAFLRTEDAGPKGRESIWD